MSTRRPRPSAAVITAFCAAITLTAGCSTSSATTADTSTSTSMSGANNSEVTVSDQWVRATDGIADPSMTTVFVPPARPATPRTHTRGLSSC